MNRQNDYIQHMKTAIQDTLIYVEGLAFDEFLEDKRTQQACIMNLIIIGEASTKLMNECGEFTQQNPHRMAKYARYEKSYRTWLF